MNDARDPWAPDQPGGRLSSRGWVRAVLAIYLVTLPACTQDAGHFGPGFFPLLAALFLVPVFATITSIDAALAWADAKQRAWARASVLVAIAMSAMAAGYWGLIVAALVELGST